MSNAVLVHFTDSAPQWFLGIQNVAQLHTVLSLNTESLAMKPHPTILMSLLTVCADDSLGPQALSVQMFSEIWFYPVLEDGVMCCYGQLWGRSQWLFCKGH